MIFMNSSYHLFILCHKIINVQYFSRLKFAFLREIIKGYKVHKMCNLNPIGYELTVKGFYFKSVSNIL